MITYCTYNIYLHINGFYVLKCFALRRFLKHIKIEHVTVLVHSTNLSLIYKLEIIEVNDLLYL